MPKEDGRRLRGMSKALFDLFFDVETKGGKWLEISIQLLIMVNLLLMMFPKPGTFAPGNTSPFLEWVCAIGDKGEDLFLLIFSLELAARSLTAIRYRRAYFRSPWFFIDVVAVAPSVVLYFLPGVEFSTQAIRAFRVFRVFKLKTLQDAGAVMREVVRRSSDELASTLAIVTSMLLACSLLMTYLESAHSAGAFSHAWKSMWWAVVTLTTVGYGDVVPETVAGKVAGALICLSGVLTFALPTAILSSSFVEVMGERKGKNGAGGAQCPHCGKAPGGH
jgi:voltage-gated potassium channel